MGDNRYHELLGLDPNVETPTYYELLLLVPADATTEAIENHYKEQMTKLQHIKSPKHKGFIEFLKDELRNAKLTLSNVDRRKDYDGKLGSKHTEAFREFAKAFMALGEVPRKVFATIVATGVSKHGIAEAEATKIVEEVMAAAGAKIASEAEPPRQVEAHASEPLPSSAQPRAPTPAPAQHTNHAAEPVEENDPLSVFDEGEAAVEHPTPVATPFAPAPLRPPAPVESGWHLADQPPADAAYGVETPRAAPPSGLQRGFGRATPAPARDPVPASPPPGRATPAPPSDVNPRVQKPNRFYGSEDAYRPAAKTTGEKATGESSGGYRPWGNAPAESSGRESRPEAGRTDSGRSEAFGRGSVDSGRFSDSGRANGRTDSGRSDSGRSEAFNRGDSQRAPDRFGSSSGDSPRAPDRFGSSSGDFPRGTDSRHGDPSARPKPGASSHDHAFPRPDAMPTPSGPSAAASARAAYQSQQDAKSADEARKSYNGGIKLSRIAIQAHVTLGEYFPRTGEMQAKINGVGYEDVLRTEHKMWKEALPFFQKALEKLTGTKGPVCEDLRMRTETCIRNLEAYLKEWKDLKFKLEFEAVKKGEMVRLYRDFVVSKRSEALNHEIPKPEGPLATT